MPPPIYCSIPIQLVQEAMAAYDAANEQSRDPPVLDVGVQTYPSNRDKKVQTHPHVKNANMQVKPSMKSVSKFNN